MKKLTRVLALSAAMALAGFGGSLGAVAQEAPPAPDAPAPEAPAPEGPEGQPEEQNGENPEDHGGENQPPQEHVEGIGSESALSEVSQKNLSDFGSCIASEKSADLLFVLDQSASLVGYEGSKPTDAIFSALMPRRTSSSSWPTSGRTMAQTSTSSSLVSAPSTTAIRLTMAGGPMSPAMGMLSKANWTSSDRRTVLRI